MALDQSTRALNIKLPPLAENEVVLTSFRGRDELSRLFEYQLDMISDNPSIQATDVVGKPVTFSAVLADQSKRFFHGHVSRFYAGDADKDGRRGYQAIVVPWFWFLTQTSDLRIFQNMTIVQIIEQVLGEYGFSDYDVSRISGHHPEREYCVQYRETDFNFISRLLEEEGVFYFFEHKDGQHIMHMADTSAAYVDCKEKKVRFPWDSGSRAIEDHILSWRHGYEFRTGKIAQTDYNFKTPSTDLMTEEQTVMSIPDVDKYEDYDYPGLYPTTGDGRPLAETRMLEEEAAHDSVEATSMCRTFTPGGKFTVGDHRNEDEVGNEYVITSVEHAAHESLAYEVGGTEGEDYRNRIICIPSSTIFKPARTTIKPTVKGLQTAVVVGPKGEEIYTDEFGRVKVQFYWDREGKKDENSSCWIRPAHNVAGKQWGFLALPRIGQEVVIDFLEGDPDRPLITGCVYNAEQMPHYALPDEKTKTYIKTNSSKGGDGHNELMFEDKNDDERLYMHAQKNMDVRVLNDSKERIFGHRHQIIGWEKDGQKGGDQKEMVYQDKHLNIKRHQLEHIEGNMHLMIGNGDAEKGGNLETIIEESRFESIGGDFSLDVGAEHKEKCGGTRSIAAGGDIHEKAGGNVAVEAGSVGEIHLKAGMKVIIEAGMQITLKGPGGFINIGPAGIDIQGILVNINSGGSPGSGSGCSPAEPDAPEEAPPDTPAIAHNSESGQKSAPD